jgi:hypothetical protein
VVARSFTISDNGLIGIRHGRVSLVDSKDGLSLEILSFSLDAPLGCTFSAYGKGVYRYLLFIIATGLHIMLKN